MAEQSGSRIENATLRMGRTALNESSRILPVGRVESLTEARLTAGQRRGGSNRPLGMSLLLHRVPAPRELLVLA